MSNSRKGIAVAAPAAILMFTMGVVVENQGRKVSGVVVHAPSGLERSGRPVADARVEYAEDDVEGVQVTSTDAKGYFEFPAGRDGVVTASKSGLTTIAVGWPGRSTSAGLRIELPQPANLAGRLYDMATRLNVREGMVSVMVDHRVNPRSSSVFVTNGQYEFRGLPPGPALLVAHADGFAPTYSVVTLDAGAQEQADVGLLLDGVVSGRAVDAAGDPVLGATVHVTYEGFEGAEILAPFIGGYTMTEQPDGRFRVNGIVPDEGFAIFAELDGRRSESFSLRATPGISIEGVVLRFD
jgi:hypothetical protein